MLTTAALNSIRDHMKTHIDHFEYTVVNNTYTASIEDSKVTSGKVVISARLDEPASGSITISSVRLYGIDGELWVQKAENIRREATAQGVYYQFTFVITEETT